MNLSKADSNNLKEIIKTIISTEENVFQMDKKYANAGDLLDQLAIHQSYWNLHFKDGVIWIPLSSKDPEDLEDELEEELF